MRDVIRLFMVAALVVFGLMAASVVAVEVTTGSGSAGEAYLGGL